jgi:hypothetical protein
MATSAMSGIVNVLLSATTLAMGRSSVCHFAWSVGGRIELAAEGSARNV